MTKIKIIRVRLLLEIERDGDGFHVFCLALKGLHVDGSTEKQAIARAKRAASAYISSILAHGDPLPVGCNMSEFEFGFFDRLKRMFSSRRHSITTEVTCPA